MGKILAGLCGWLVGDIVGALVGIFIGHQFDRGLGVFLRPISKAELKLVRETFFVTLFKLAGHLAKADGHVSSAEILHAEQIMVRMGLSAERRKEAISFFKLGAEPAFALDDSLGPFVTVCSNYKSLKLQLVSYLISLALADGTLDGAEETILCRIADQLEFPKTLIHQLIDQIRAQDSFSDFSQPQADEESDHSRIARAYSALGVVETSSDAQLKKAYRVLIGQNHPDKLIGQGVPDDMIQLATERTQEIQAAYEAIVEARRRSAS